MTKKILALALAGTTAFSVFGSVMTASAVSSHTAAYKGTIVPAYIPYVSIAYTQSSHTITLTAATGGTNASIAEASVTNDTLKGFAAKFIFDEGGLPQITGNLYSTGNVYFMDYVLPSAANSATSADKTALENVLSKIAALPANASGYTAGDSGYATKADAIDALADALNAYLKDGTTNADFTASVSYNVDGTTNATRRSTYATFETYYNKAKTGTFDASDWESDDISGSTDNLYNFDALNGDIRTAWTNMTSSVTTSYMKYLMSEYDRLTNGGYVTGADDSSFIDQYAVLKDRFAMLNEEDYDYEDWLNAQTQVTLADRDAGNSKWEDAVTKMKAALAIIPKAADLTELRTTLLSMYSDATGKSYVSYIQPTYTTVVNGRTVSVANAVYQISDYGNYAGNSTVAWSDLTQNSFYFDLDKNGSAEAYAGVYAFAYKVYADTTRNSKTYGQSIVNYANEVLTAAIESLDPSSHGSDWDILKLESALELITSLDETDFNTTARAWKEVQTAAEKAETVLSKSNASKSEVQNAFTRLDAAAKKVPAVSKSVPYSLQQEFRTALKDAQKFYEEAVADKSTGTQIINLKNAIDKANNRKFATVFDVEGTTEKLLISDYNEMIAELEAAIANYNQPQGWYQNEDGGWMYGEGDTYVASDWKKVGTKWFYFEDGVAVESNWRQIGGKYYYFNQYCVALTNCWGKVDGGWYYFGADSAMKTGWLQIGTTWYYLNPTSGRMMTGWVSVNGKSYYFNADGAMLTSTTTPDGYEVGADGAWIQK